MNIFPRGVVRSPVVGQYLSKCPNSDPKNSWLHACVNPGCLKYISGIDLSPVKKKNVYSFIHFYNLKTKEDLLKELHLKVSLFLNYLVIL